MTRIKFHPFGLDRAVWFAIGAVSLAPGAIGAVIPVLSTTPFVILGAFAFTKAWPPAAEALENHPVFRPIIADWRASGAIAPRYKFAARLMMLLALSLSIVARLPLGLLAVQAACMACASIYILSRPNGGETNGEPDHLNDQAGN